MKFDAPESISYLSRAQITGRTLEALESWALGGVE
jgi:hypothetical protein